MGDSDDIVKIVPTSPDPTSHLRQQLEKLLLDDSSSDGSPWTSEGPFRPIGNVTESLLLATPTWTSEQQPRHDNAITDAIKSRMMPGEARGSRPWSSGLSIRDRWMSGDSGFFDEAGAFDESLLLMPLPWHPNAAGPMSRGRSSPPRASRPRGQAAMPPSFPANHSGRGGSFRQIRGQNPDTIHGKGFPEPCDRGDIGACGGYGGAIGGQSGAYGRERSGAFGGHNGTSRGDRGAFGGHSDALGGHNGTSMGAFGGHSDAFGGHNGTSMGAFGGHNGTSMGAFGRHSDAFGGHNGISMGAFGRHSDAFGGHNGTSMGALGGHNDAFGRGHSGAFGGHNSTTRGDRGAFGGHYDAFGGGHSDAFGGGHNGAFGGGPGDAFGGGHSGAFGGGPGDTFGGHSGAFGGGHSGAFGGGPGDAFGGHSGAFGGGPGDAFGGGPGDAFGGGPGDAFGGGHRGAFGGGHRGAYGGGHMAIFGGHSGGHSGPNSGVSRGNSSAFEGHSGGHNGPNRGHSGAYGGDNGGLVDTRNVKWLANAKLHAPAAKMTSPLNANRGRPVLGKSDYPPSPTAYAPALPLDLDAFRPRASRGQQGRSLRAATMCSFCQRNGETPEFYNTHKLKDPWGRVVCPVLRAYVCPKCGCSGDNAHTIKYCPSK